MENKINVDDKTVVSGAALAKILGVTERRISQLVTEGVITRRGRGKYGLIENVNSYVAFWKERVPDPLTGEATADLQEEKARLTKAQADKAEMEAARLRGELLEIEKVEKAWVKVLTTVKTSLLALPSKLAPIVFQASDKAETEAILRENIHEALEELAESEIPEID